MKNFESPQLNKSSEMPVPKLPEVKKEPKTVEQFVAELFEQYHKEEGNKN